MTDKKRKIWSVLRRICILGFWLIAVSGLGVSLAWVNKHEQSVPCKNIVVKIAPAELEFYNRQSVIQRLSTFLDGKKLKGSEISDIQTGMLEEKLKSQPAIEDADLYYDYQGTLRIRVQQQTPILRVIRYDGGSYYIDRKGNKFPLSAAYTAHVPVANGNIFEPFNAHEKVYSFIGQQLYKMALYVDNDPFWKAQIEQIFVTGAGEFILVPRLGGHVLEFGDSTDMEAKFSKLLVFYREGLNRLGWSRYSTINVKYKDQVICIKKDSTHVN